jgi:integrase
VSVYKRGEVYWVEFQIGGKRIRQSTGEASKRQALVTEKELRQQYAQDLHANRTGSHHNKTYADALLRWIESGAPESMLSHARNTRPYLDNVKLPQVPAAAHDMKVDMKKQGLSVLTINRRLSVVRRVLNLAFNEWDWISQPLGKKINLYSEKGTNREIYLTPEEVTLLVSNIHNEAAKKVTLLAAYTGLRQGEIMNLQPEEWQDPFIILKSKGTKAKRPRKIPVIDAAKSLVTPPFNLSQSDLRKHFEAAREAIERPEIRYHDLRHTFASWLASNPLIPLTVIRDLMGHSSLAVTSKYAHLRDDHKAILEQSLPTNLHTKPH